MLHICSLPGDVPDDKYEGDIENVIDFGSLACRSATDSI